MNWYFQAFQISNVQKNIRKFDIIIVGGGISGSLMAFELLQHGKTVLLIHSPMTGEATPISSGLINPITGLRFVKTWKYELLRERMLFMYLKLQEHFQSNFIFEHEILIELSNAQEENNWHTRLGEESYGEFCKAVGHWDSNLYRNNLPYSYGKITKSHQVDLSAICKNIHNELMIMNQYEEFIFDYSLCRIEHNLVNYDDKFRSKSIIFCEGSRVLENPYFNWIPIASLKGERLLLDTTLQESIIYHGKYSIIPMRKHLWIGSNYSLSDRSLSVTLEEKMLQLEFAKTILQIPVTCIDHSFGIRAASRDRRPVVGRHPNYNNLYILNGLGTKGASLAPYCVELLAEMILNDKEPDQEINLKRFVKRMV